MPRENSTIRKVRVVTAHIATYADTLRAKRGELLTCGRRDDEWPGWLWCTSAEGKSGWVPESYLRIAEARATVLRDYDASELTVSSGEILHVETEESGWLLCVNATGQRGWIPARSVEDIITKSGSE
ncbi:MAG: SH3 domain-containing protein [bacterium]